MKFGPSGNSDSFFSEGHKSSLETPLWLHNRGLDIFEYSFGRGIIMSRQLATEFGAEAEKYNIELSAHAPYYINFATPEEENQRNDIGYLLKVVEFIKYFKGKRCVIHPGCPMKQARGDALYNLLKNFDKFAGLVTERKLDDVYVCPETMGKFNQMGTLEEILEICKLSDIFLPCIDFGHINSRSLGGLKSSDDYRVIINKIYETIGEERGKKMHIHFSNIEYGQKGEIRHLTYEDKKFGPFFEHLIPVLIEYKVDGWLLTESAGTQAEEALMIKTMYSGLSNH